MSEDYRTWRMQRIQEQNPDLWRFLEGVESYLDDRKEDLTCRRWQHILQIAYFIADTNCSTYRCEPGAMKLTFSQEYRDHHSDEGVSLGLNRAVKITEAEYHSLREAYNQLPESHKESLLFEFSNIFYLKPRADFLEDDYLVCYAVHPDVCYRYHIAVVARIKEMEGYYLFEFKKG